MAEPTKKPTKRKRPNRQHAVKGSSWIRFAKELRDQSVTGLNSRQVLDLIAIAAETEGKRVRHLR